MELNAFLNSYKEVTSFNLSQFAPYIKSLQQQKEMAVATNKLDWQSELDCAIRHCETIKLCLYVFKHKKDIEEQKPGASQFEIDIIQLEAQLKLRSIDTETSYKKWKESGKFLL